MRLSGDLYGSSHGRIDLSMFGGKTERLYLWQGCGCMDTGSEYCIRCYSSFEKHSQDIEDRMFVCSPDLKEFKGHTCSRIQRDTIQSVVVPWLERREPVITPYIQHLYTVNHGQGLEQHAVFNGLPWGRTKEFYYYCRLKHIQSFFEKTEKEECVYYEEP